MPRRRGAALLDEWLLCDAMEDQINHGTDEDEDWIVLGENDGNMISMSQLDALWRQPPTKYNPVVKALKRDACRRERRRGRPISAQASVGDEPEAEGEPEAVGELSNDLVAAPPSCRVDSSVVVHSSPPNEAESARDPDDAGVMTSVMWMMLMNSKMEGPVQGPLGSIGLRHRRGGCGAR